MKNHLEKLVLDAQKAQADLVVSHSKAAGAAGAAICVGGVRSYPVTDPPVIVVFVVVVVGRA